MIRGKYCGERCERKLRVQLKSESSEKVEGATRGTNQMASLPENLECEYFGSFVKMEVAGKADDILAGRIKVSAMALGGKPRQKMLQEEVNSQSC